MATSYRRKRVATIPDRYLAFIDGTITVDDLDEEEIMRGQLKNAQGDFRGRPNKFIPRELMQQIIERRDAIFAAQLMPMAKTAMSTLESVSKHGSIQDGPRVQAAKTILEYTIGKPTEKIAIRADITVNKYDHIIQASTVALTQGDEEIVDAEEVEDEL